MPSLDDTGASPRRDGKGSESSWFQRANMFASYRDYMYHTNSPCMQSRSRRCAPAPLCYHYRLTHRHRQGQTGFAAPLDLSQTGLLNWKYVLFASSVSRSLSSNRQRRLAQLQDGASLLKRRRSRIIQDESLVSSSMLSDAPLEASSSKSNIRDHGLTSREAPKILMLTDKWVAVDKPPGILVHRTKLYKSAAGEKYLTDYVSHLVEQETGVIQKILPVQRLDRPTSGVIVFALGCASNASELQAALKSQDCIKQYWALAFGAHMPKKWVNDHPLKDIDGKERKQRNARTEFEVLEVFHTADVVAVSACLSTGRRHQVRRHLSNSRHSILGDTSYSKGKLNRMVRDIYEVQRCCLHSQTLSFKDPSTGDQITIDAPIPHDLRNVLSHLSNLKASTI